jgi:hypothetical protein
VQICRKIEVIIFAFYDNEGKEIHRNDITDRYIIDRVKNSLIINIPSVIHNIAQKCLWWPKFTDNEFGARSELLIIKNGTKYLL